MSKSERIREELGWLKLFFAGFLAVDVSVVAWLAQNYRVAETVMISGALCLVVLVTAGLVLITRRAYRRLEDLEKA